MSSWVDSGLEAARYTWAPPAVSVWTSTAVSAVTCRQAAIFSPANGCCSAKADVSMPSTGIDRPAQAIPGWPASASPGSAMSDAAAGPARPPAPPSVAVVIGLVRAIDRDADVVGLLLG